MSLLGNGHYLPDVRIAPAAVTAALLLSACGASPADPASRTAHSEGDGPLSAAIGVGGSSILAPAQSTWTGTFGGFVLCAQESGRRIEVQDVRYQAGVEPVEVVPTVRTTTPESLRGLEPRRRQDYLPTYTALGSPPGFDEPYVDLVVPGDYSTVVRGWRVDQSCEQTAALERQLSGGRVPSRPLRELMFAVTAGRQGARIDRVDIDYLADGRPMTLELRWAMVSCGTATVTPDTCRRR